MIKKQMLRILMFLAILSPITMLAQTFELSGELRPRFENRHGYKTLPTPENEAAAFISQRTRLNGLYSDEKVRVGFSLQDIRVWGDVPQLVISDGKFSVHEAWGELSFSDGLSLKAGRQEIVYDDSRIFGNVGWAQQARSHDAALLKYQHEQIKLHAGAALNRQNELLFYEANPFGNYKAFQYFWGNYSADNWNLSLLALNTGYQSPEDDLGTVYNQTIGGRLVYNPGSLFLSASSYLQTGEDANANDLNAGYLKLDATYTLTSEWKVGLGYEMLSGNDQDADDDENNAFTPIFGTNHKFNGWMDYFYVGNHINSVGLNDMYVSVNYQKNKISSGVKAHLFSADGNIMDPQNTSETLDDGLGTEVDFHLKYKFSGNTTLSAGYSRMFATETMEAIKGGDADEKADWFWMMITIKPKFL
jgi:hypothetical protein